MIQDSGAQSPFNHDLRHSDPDWARLSPYLEAGDDIDLLYYLYQGLIFPKETNLMLRCRMSGGELSSEQVTTLADIAETHGAGYADVTTRANFQIRDIADSDGIIVLKKLLHLGIAPAVKGLNNLRNVTVTPTTGFDTNELIDVMPIAKDIHNCLLYKNELQGLPGKFNIALDSGGKISVASEANDLGIKAVSVNGKVYFRLSVADIRNETTISQDLNWLIKPEDIVTVTSVIIETYLTEGDFSKRLRSRLKFLINQIGIEEFKSKVKSQLTASIIEDDSAQTPPERLTDAHLGVHDQHQDKLCYLGVNGAAGRYTSQQLRKLATVAQKFGNSNIRLTTLQNCLVPHVDRANLNAVIETFLSQSLTVTSKLAGSIVACTGSSGCSYSATATKEHSLELSQYLQKLGDYNEAVNIHFTGCPFSCAQNYIGDIGLIGVRVKNQECYHVYLGGGADVNLSAVRVRKAIPYKKLASYIKSLLDLFKQEKLHSENFNSFVHRYGINHFTQSAQVGGMI
ncbi:MAG: precorrin-3B synthase [Akkermansiaceae bacterium]